MFDTKLLDLSFNFFRMCSGSTMNFRQFSLKIIYRFGIKSSDLQVIFMVGNF